MTAPRPRHEQSFLSSCLNLSTAVLRVVLWPVRVVFTFLFPFGETDGLSNAVTEKAAQQFVSYLRNSVGAAAASPWSTSGFSAVKQEAIANHSLVFLYLHSPIHHQTQQFCEQVLGQNPILSWVQEDKVIATGVSIHTGQGAHLQNLLSVDMFPALAVLQPGPSNSLQLVFKAEGYNQCQQIIPQLQHIQQGHQAAVIAHETRRLQREEDERLRREQDNEFQATLAADQERERRQAEEREAAAAQEEAEMKEKEAADDELRRVRELVLPEPASGGAMVRFCLPTGTKLNRRFQSNQTIASLKAFVRTHCVDSGLQMGTISLSTNFPRKTFGDDDLTVEEAGLAPQSVLMVQDLDA